MQPRNSHFTDSHNYSLKRQVIGEFYKTVTENMTNAGCSYFAHNITKNREEPIQPDNLIYWEHYWDYKTKNYEDYVIRKKIGYGCTPGWSRSPNASSSITTRTEMCRMKDGFHFYIQHKEGIQENYSFGWEKHNADQVSYQKLNKLTKVISESGVGFFRLNADMFETYPAVY